MRKALIPGFCCSLLFSWIVSTAQAAGVDQDRVVRPEGTSPPTIDRAELVAKGEQLWHDKSLSKNGKTACASCHKGNTRMFKKTFLDPYPHYVKMAKKKADLDQISTEGMVQFCMLVPMKTDTLPWDSVELAALSAYTEDVVQKAYIEKKGKK